MLMKESNWNITFPEWLNIAGKEYLSSKTISFLQFSVNAKSSKTENIEWEDKLDDVTFM